MSDHKGSANLDEFFGWSDGKWRRRPIKIFRNVAVALILLLIIGLIITSLMRCDWFAIFCS